MKLTLQDGKLRNETPLEAAARRCRELKQHFDAANRDCEDLLAGLRCAEKDYEAFGVQLAEARAELDRLVYGEAL